MTVFDRIKSMTKNELAEFISAVYAWGHINEKCDVDDECFYEHLLDMPCRMAKEIVDALSELHLCKIRIISNGKEPEYMNTMFFSTDDALHYIYKYNNNDRRSINSV